MSLRFTIQERYCVKSLLLQQLQYIFLALFFVITIPQITLARPIIFSYYWPVAKVKVINNEITLNSFTHLDINSVTHIDILPHAIHGNYEVREYWKGKGKYILNRVYPFKGYDNSMKSYVKLKTYEEIYNNIDRVVKTADGVSIDELIGSGRSKISEGQREIVIQVLSEIRRNYPKKIIAVWGSAKWDDDNISLLKAIYQHCDLFISEIYLSEYYTKINDYSLIEKNIKDLGQQCPGILDKTIIGLGIYDKLDTEKNILFSDHVKKQLDYIFLNPLLSRLNGIAFYAPVYSDDKQFLLDIDSMIRKAYFPANTLDSF